MTFIEKSRITFLVFLLVAPLAFAANQEKTRAAEKAVAEWLELVDEKQYESSWIQSASLFRNAISSSDWARAIERARGPLGSVVSRQLVSATYTTTLPGAPDGEYVVMQYQTRFENKARGIETITPMLDEGQWRVSGYFVR